jgi:hypothetical protein
MDKEHRKKKMYHTIKAKKQESPGIDSPEAGKEHQIQLFY